MRTLAIIKPDAVSAGNAGAIISRILEAGFQIVCSKQHRLDLSEVTAMYGASATKPWYPRHAEFMASGQSILLVLEADDAPARWRALIGSANPRTAGEHTIRGQFGAWAQEPGHCYRNAVHGSDSAADAEREIGIFFSASWTYAWKPIVPEGSTWTLYSRAEASNRAHWASIFPAHTIPYIEDQQDRTNYLLNEIDRISGRLST